MSLGIQYSKYLEEMKSVFCKITIRVVVIFLPELLFFSIKEKNRLFAMPGYE